jgi:mRNA interferase RelE/StbE
MARYELRFKTSVSKDLRGLPTEEVRRILARVEALRDNPRPPGAEKLAGREQYRIRQGVYRISYGVNDVVIVVEVIKVGHRREVYR